MYVSAYEVFYSDIQFELYSKLLGGLQRLWTKCYWYLFTTVITELEIRCMFTIKKGGGGSFQLTHIYVCC